MSGPKTARKEREDQVQNMERAVKNRLADLVPEVESLSPKDVDGDLEQVFGSALEKANTHLEKVKGDNGKNGLDDEKKRK